MNRKKKPQSEQRPSTRDVLTKLHARVWYLEQIERREAEYRRALAILRRREAQVKEARTALDKAAAAFLDPYAPQELTFSQDANPTASSTGRSLVRKIDFKVPR